MTDPNPRGGCALLRKAGLLARSFFRPPSRNGRRPSGYGRCCRAYSGGSAPVLHRTSRTPSEAVLSTRSLYDKRRECQTGLTPPPHSEPCAPPRMAAAPRLGEGRLGIICLEFTPSVSPKSPRGEDDRDGRVFSSQLTEILDIIRPETPESHSGQGGTTLQAAVGL